MADRMERPAPVPGPGLLCKEHGHLGYVTNDMDRAVEILGRRYGLTRVSFIEGPMPQGGQIRVAFAWAGGQIYEIIQASGPGTEFYNEMLPQGEFAIRFHHLGFTVHDQEGWQQLEQELGEDGWPIAHSTLAHNFIDAYYVKAPELGHYVEYVRPFQAGIDFYASVPVN